MSVAVVVLSLILTLFSTNAVTSAVHPVLQPSTDILVAVGLSFPNSPFVLAIHTPNGKRSTVLLGVCLQNC